VRIKKEIEDTLVKTYKDAASYSIAKENGNRSSVRTTILNAGAQRVIDRYLPGNPSDWHATNEVKINCARATSDDPKKTFSIDVVYTHMPTGRKLYVLLKSVERSYNKNRANFANCSIGEVERIYGDSEFHGDILARQRNNHATLFLSLVPDRVLAPTDKKPGHYEKTKKSAPRISNLRRFNQNIHQIQVSLKADGKGNTKENLDSISEVSNIKEVIEKLEDLKENITRLLSL